MGDAKGAVQRFHSALPSSPYIEHFVPYLAARFAQSLVSAADAGESTLRRLWGGAGQRLSLVATPLQVDSVPCEYHCQMPCLSIIRKQSRI